MARRRLVTAATMLSLWALLVAAAVVGWRSLFGMLPGEESGGNGTGSGCPTEQVEAGSRVRSSQVQVSVFNSGDREGLADRTMTSLLDRGFRPGAVENAPSAVDVARVEVWSTVDDDPAARLVALQFGPRTTVRYTGDDLGPGVDVVIGNDLGGLVPATTSLEVTRAGDACVDGQ